jgi:glycosyltransferase involved in cell wall biosynthesis
MSDDVVIRAEGLGKKTAWSDAGSLNLRNADPMFSASVIICSHNPRSEYLARVLAGLRSQDTPMSQWELILIDNASSNSLQSYDLSWHPLGRHVFEHNLGRSCAVQRGIVESKSDVLVFVDDDNVLAPDFLRQALKIARERRALALGAAVCSRSSS